jgi:heptosyltransferase III
MARPFNMAKGFSDFYSANKETPAFRLARKAYRLFFWLWCFIRTCFECIWNAGERKKLAHKVTLWRSYVANKYLLGIKLNQVRSQNSQRRVIVIAQAVHMGDIIACEPVIRDVRKKNPDGFIIFACEKAYRELADSHPEVDYTLPLKCISEWIHFAGFKGFDEVIDLNISGRTCPVCGVPWLKPAGNHGVTLENYYSIGSLLNAFAKSAGIEVSPLTPKVFPRESDMRMVSELDLPKSFVSMHAGSNEAERDLPLETWKSIVRHINERWNLPVAEIGLRPVALTGSKDLNRQLSGRLSILQSAEVIHRSVLYIGCDSGPAHLANAVETYGIIVLGHYRHFQRCMPYTGNYAEGRFCNLLYHNGPAAQMLVERILEAIDQRLATLPNVAA